MYKILKAETLAAKIHLMVVHAPRVASLVSQDNLLSLS